jgi:hypothetical protein
MHMVPLTPHMHNIMSMVVRKKVNVKLRHGSRCAKENEMQLTNHMFAVNLWKQIRR